MAREQNRGLVVRADGARDRLILEFFGQVEDDIDNQNDFVDILSGAVARFGGDVDLIIDYSNFRESAASMRVVQHFAAGAAALAEMGVRRRVRVLPERLDGFFAPFAHAVAGAGLQVVTVRSLADAHALLDMAAAASTA